MIRFSPETQALLDQLKEDLAQIERDPVDKPLREGSFVRVGVASAARARALLNKDTIKCTG